MVASLVITISESFIKSGKTNVEADVLSRIPRDSHTVIEQPSVKAIMNAVPYTDWSEYNFNPCDIVCRSTQIVVHKKSEMIGKLNRKVIPL